MKIEEEMKLSLISIWDNFEKRESEENSSAVRNYTAEQVKEIVEEEEDLAGFIVLRMGYLLKEGKDLSLL